MKLSDIRNILAAHQIQLTRSLGQNFLHDGNQLQKIADQGQLKATDSVLEIGPGLGPLTELLVEQAGHVLAVELDGRLTPILAERFAGNPRLEVLRADALHMLQKQPRDWSAWKMVSNLPYSVASPILVELAQAPGSPSLMVATLQSEVAQRLAAAPDSDAYGLLTLLVQLRYESTGWFKIPGACFYPAPDVDSACVTLVRRPEPLLTMELEPHYYSLVKRSFAQRRKMMLKQLKPYYSLEALHQAFETVGISTLVRAEVLSVQQFVQLTQVLHHEIRNM